MAWDIRVDRVQSRRANAPAFGLHRRVPMCTDTQSDEVKNMS
jgi:hypothetical protein